MNYFYLLALLLLCATYLATLFCMKYMKNHTVTNLVFVCLTVVPYVVRSVIIYNDVGLYDWNFTNTLPTANVSPFMFTLVAFVLLLPKKVKKPLFLLVSLLSVGMFLSSAGGCVYNAVINYKFHFHFLLDYVSHFALSLFGIYLVRSKQIDFSTKNCLISGGIIFACATVMLLLNVIFDTAFWGLSLNGKHNIYNVVVTSNSYLSAVLYYLGLGIILFGGYIVSRVFSKPKFALVKLD